MSSMSATPDDPLEQALSILSRLAEEARRVLAGPDGPLALALVLGLVAMLEVTLYTDAIGSALIANLLATVPLAMSRTRIWLAAPLIVFGVLLAIGDPESTLTIAAVLGLVTSLYLFAVRYRWRWSALLAFPFLVNAIEPLGGDEPGFPGVLLLALVIAALVLGESQRERGEAVAERDESRRAMAESLQQQAEMTERARIARELHDVVAHHVSAIAVQAETARLTTEGMPEEGKAQLEAIGDTARDALGEMRRVLGVLRSDEGTEADREPQPGLARLDELVDTARATGTNVRLTQSGTPVQLPQGVDLCAYRILQEALTNARRHAPGATVDVEIEFSDETLRLRVRDDGPGASAEQVDGHGLLGMRERAIMVGGTLTVGPAEQGGFEVTAELPIPGSS
jgi:signal transduction histidine kinase